jgi:hypothetical protein
MVEAVPFLPLLFMCDYWSLLQNVQLERKEALFNRLTLYSCLVE